MRSALEGNMAPASPALQQYAAQREELLDAYFTDTQLLHVLQSFVTTLATDFKTRRVLPANPYTMLLVAIRQSEIQRSLVLNGSFPKVTTSPALVLHDQQQPTSALSPHFRLCSTKELLARSLWGFQSGMERIPDVAQLAHRVDTIQEIHPSWFNAAQDDQNDDQYRVAVFAALVGDSNKFPLEQYPVVEMEQHVVVSGELLEKAMAVFARQLFKFLHELTSSSKTLGCSGISITPSSTNSSFSGEINTTNGLKPQPQQSRVWTPESVSANRNAFAAAVKIAIVSNASFEISSFSSTTRSLSAPPVPNNSSNDGSQFICQTRQRFFFHFVWENATTSTTTKAVKPPQQQQQNRSFLTGTRVIEFGLFSSARGALEIASRMQMAQDAAATATTNVNGKKASTTSKQQQPQTSKRPNAVPDPPSSLNLCSSGERLVASVLERLRLHTSPQETRKWTNCFTSSCGFALLTLVLHNQVLIDLLLGIQDNYSVAVDCRDALKSHFEISSSHLQALVEQARVGSTSSLLKSVGAFLRTLWEDAHTVFLLSMNGSDDSEELHPLTKLTEPLETVNELLLVVACVAVQDFVELAQSHTQATLGIGSGSTLAQEDNPQDEQIDVLRALQTAVDERAYPPLVALECVLAQFLVDSCVDVALESAVLNIVASHLPPNPFIELSHHVRVFALRQLVWSRPPSSASNQEHTSQVQAYKDNDVVLMKPSEVDNVSHTLYGANHSLLEAIEPEQVWKAHQWLQQHGIFRIREFQPLRSSYSIQVLHSLLAFHPTAFATSQSSNSVMMTNQFLQELEIVEHVIVEGREFAQALEFFAGAVAHDLRRLAGHEQLLFPIQVEIRGPMDDIVSEVNHHLGDSDSDMVMLELVQEATRAKCLLRVQLTLFIESPASKSSGGDTNEDATRLHIVGKSYVFHHKPTEFGLQAQQCVSELLAFRLTQLGVFFAPETAELVLESLGINFPAEELQPEFWTPFARQALENDDLFLKYELDFCAREASACTTPYHATADHKNGILLQRLTVHSWILPLYSIVSPLLVLRMGCYTAD